MAMGRRTRDEAERAIRNCRPFQNSTRSMRGTRGSTRDLGWLSNHREANRIKELLSRATYVVWSYDTPIGCVTEDDDGNITKVYFDESHTTTTSHHQGILRVAFSDFETVGTGPWSRSHGRGDGPVRSRPQTSSVRELGSRVDPVSDARDNGYILGGPRDGYPSRGRMATNHRGVQYDPLVERDTSWERDMVEARMQSRPTRDQMLDPRYGDPNWTPWNREGSSLPPGADERDAQRVEQEQAEGRGWRP